MPKGSNVGDFVHEDDVWSFLNLMATENEQNQYPYSNENIGHYLSIPYGWFLE